MSVRWCPRCQDKRSFNKESSTVSKCRTCGFKSARSVDGRIPDWKKDPNRISNKSQRIDERNSSL